MNKIDLKIEMTKPPHYTHGVYNFRGGSDLEDALIIGNLSFFRFRDTVFEGTYLKAALEDFELSISYHSTSHVKGQESVVSYTIEASCGEFKKRMVISEAQIDRMGILYLKYALAQILNDVRSKEVNKLLGV